ncbi:hypothetical protein ACN267_32115 [Micromonospora sp. WMMD734]|uniref:hypothetical protein n=1 Tax=Micromonospora sp. WMMD734 TaxID=3404129 RepID=UPI003B9511D8
MPPEPPSLERALFGLPDGAGPAEAISYRDAADRVAAITSPGQLGALITRATDSGDDMLRRAALAHACRQGWHGLVVDHAGPAALPLLDAA